MRIAWRKFLISPQQPENAVERDDVHSYGWMEPTKAARNFFISLILGGFWRFL